MRARARALQKPTIKLKDAVDEAPLLGESKLSIESNRLTASGVWVALDGMCCGCKGRVEERGTEPIRDGDWGTEVGNDDDNDCGRDGVGEKLALK